MKAYVVTQMPKRDQLQMVEVVYGAALDADSVYPTLQAAESACQALNDASIRVGKHRCAFSVERLRHEAFGDVQSGSDIFGTENEGC